LKHRVRGSVILLICALCGQTAWSAAPQSEAVTREMAHDIFKQLIEINTTDSIGSTTLAAQAMAKRLLDAGFPQADITVIGPNDRKGNMVARYRGRPNSKLRPILIIGHTDVVEARREDWTTDPFKFVEQDGYYYGRGTQDMKEADALAALEKSPFPFELNAVTREYFSQMAKIETGQAAADLRAILSESPDSAAI
jgi:hypothetical protein